MKEHEGNIASHVVPGKMVPGMSGAMAPVVGAKKVIVAMQHTAKGNPKIMKTCSLPLTGMQCVEMIVTEKAVFEVTKKGLLLKEILPGSSLDDIKEATDADFQ